MATDYKTECGSSPLSFIQLLASTIFGSTDLAGVLHYRLNAVIAADHCTELTDPLDCDTSHIDPERRLVENVFILDDCDQLAIKLFSNSDNDWIDYSECGEVPLTFIQLMARTIRTYATETKINAVLDADACTAVTALLDCSVNQIEAERLLVANLFATDDCGNLLIKMFSNTSTMTDYSTSCNDIPQTFYQMLARAIVLYDGHYYLNIASVTGNCEDLTAFWSCALSHVDPESALVENLFATDDCGNIALKIFNNSGEVQ